MQFLSIFGIFYNVGLGVGMMIEDRIPGSKLGLLATTILRNEFEEQRRNPCWFERIFATAPNLRDAIRQVTLADLVFANSNSHFRPTGNGFHI